MANLQYNYCEDTSYVDIHGRDIRVFVCQKTGRILVPIDELKEMGFSIYRKNQYNKLLIDDLQFTQEFNLYMLDCAQNYMLKKKISFNVNEILESINNCKKLLAGSVTENTCKKEVGGVPPSKFFQNHVVQQNNDENITVTSSFRQPAPMTVKNVNLLNDTKSKPSSRQSSGSVSSEGSRRGKNFSFEESDNGFDGRKPKNSFEKKQAGPNASFEQNKQKNFNPTGSSSPQIRNDIKRPALNAKNHFTQENEAAQDEQRRLYQHQTLSKPQHTVVVTFLESPTVAWVQDADNANILVEIADKISEDVKNERVVTRCDFHSVYLAQDDGEWYRCKPIKFKPLTVTFLDYGNTAQVNESDLREVSKDLAQIPAQAIRVTFEDPHFKPALYDTITINPITRKERGTYLVKVAKKNGAMPKTVNKSEPVQKEAAKPTCDVFFARPEPLGTLESGQRIMVIGETDGRLVVRTKECYDKFKQVEQQLESLKVEPLPDKPDKQQLVVVYKDGKAYRGQVIGVDGASVEVELLDYYDRLKVDLSAVKNITESLSKEPVTYLITPPLKDYSGNAGVKRYVEELVEKNAKAAVVLNGQEELDLKLGNSLLSDMLKQLDNVSSRVMLKNLNTYKPPLGNGTYMLYACRGSDNVTLVSEEEIEKYVDNIIKTDLDDDEPYEPIVGEVCLGDYQGSWSRCVALRSVNGRFEVKFIDFGNVEFLKAEKLRKLTDDTKGAPVLGVQCKFVGLPPIAGIDELLKEVVSDDDRYQLNVKKFDGTSYEIEAPGLYKLLAEAGN